MAAETAEVRSVVSAEPSMSAIGLRVATSISRYTPWIRSLPMPGLPGAMEAILTPANSVDCAGPGAELCREPLPFRILGGRW